MSKLSIEQESITGLSDEQYRDLQELAEEIYGLFQ